MKKQIFALITFTALVLAVTVSLGAQTFRVVDEYQGDREQGPVWFYLVRVDGGAWQELRHVSTLPAEYRAWGDNWQFSSNPHAEGIYFSFCTWEGVVTVQSGNMDDKKYEVALGFRAPSAGRAAISNFQVISHGPENPADPPAGPIALTFVHGTRQLGSTNVSGRTGTVRGVNATMAAGDMLYIIVDPLRVDVTNVILDNLAVNFRAN